MDFRGASAHTLDTLTARLADQPAEPAELVTLGDELFAMSVLVEEQVALRRVLTDTSVVSDKRRELARQVFEGKVGPIALDLVVEASGLRWNRSHDLVNGLERLSEIALSRSTGDQADRLVDELFAVDAAVQNDVGLRDALSDDARSLEDRSRLVDDLIGEKALPVTVDLVKQALRGRYRTVADALDAVQEVAAGVRDEGVATVQVARPLSAEDQRRLAAALARRYGREIHLNMVVDPEVIGGVRVEIGPDVIDGTIARRLDDVRRRLTV